MDSIPSWSRSVVRSNRGTRCAAHGFTLLEVLIALAILAISAAALLRQTELQVKHQLELEAKTYAMWLADDTMAALLAQPQWPPLGRTEREATAGDRSWRVLSDVQSTPDELVRKIEISVGPANVAGDPALVSFTGYRGRY
jgi:general secretion pathway protein I